MWPCGCGGVLGHGGFSPKILSMGKSFPISVLSCAVLSPSLTGCELLGGTSPTKTQGGPMRTSPLLLLLQPCVPVPAVLPAPPAAAAVLCVAVRSHACEPDQFGKPGGCSDICLLGNSHKSRTCRCRSGFSLGSDGKSCKSECWPNSWANLGDVGLEPCVLCRGCSLL